MPVLRRGRCARPGAAGPPGPALERVFAFAFTAADSSTGHAGTGPPESGRAELGRFQEHMESLYGPFADVAWLAEGTAVSYHDMARVIARRMADELADVDLLITVAASPDCRQFSLPGCVLASLAPGEPLMFGLSEQGIAGPFTALRIAADLIAAGTSRRALVLVMEQRTVPPDDGVTRPQSDVAVGLLLGGDHGVRLDRPQVTVVGRGSAPAALPALPDAGAFVLGTGIEEPATSGAAVTRAEDGHPCAGVWLALARFLRRGGPPGSRVLVADRDPVLPYACTVLLTLPADVPEPPSRAPSLEGGLSDEHHHDDPAGPSDHAYARRS